MDHVSQQAQRISVDSLTALFEELTNAFQVLEERVNGIEQRVWALEQRPRVTEPNRGRLSSGSIYR